MWILKEDYDLLSMKMKKQTNSTVFIYTQFLVTWCLSFTHHVNSYICVCVCVWFFVVMWVGWSTKHNTVGRPVSSRGGWSYSQHLHRGCQQTEHDGSKVILLMAALPRTFVNHSGPTPAGDTVKSALSVRSLGSGLVWCPCFKSGLVVLHALT